MARITFHKRQKEIKRQEKRKIKAEKRAQKKMAKSASLQLFVSETDNLENKPTEPVQLDGVASQE